MVALPKDFLSSAFFLCTDSKEKESGIKVKIPKATASLVSVPIENSQVRTLYAVTARHCINQARFEGEVELHLRLNRVETGLLEIPSSIEDWFLSDQSDVAVIPLVPSMLPHGITMKEVGVGAFRVEHFVGPAPEYLFTGEVPLIGEVAIQPSVGTEIYGVGLFTQHYGDETNLPLARFGHIARMPSSLTFKEPDGTAFKDTGYLAEFHSWSGFSGSPVYFLEPQTIVKVLTNEQDQPIAPISSMGWVSGLLGLISSHYSEASKLVTKDDLLKEVHTSSNAAVAIVVPADTIRQLLYRDDLITQRANLLETITKQVGSEADILPA